MRLRSLLGVWVSKVVTLALKAMGRRATSLPGLVALRFDEMLPVSLMKQIKVCVLVTGTNGKTTTTELLHSLLSTQDEPWLINRGGANLLQGIVVPLLRETDWRGRLRVTRVVFEVDEATMPVVVMSTRPRMIVLTNVLRDQLDRYGEIDYTVAMLQSALMNPAITLVTNADDPLCTAIAGKRKNAVFFGFTPGGQGDAASTSSQGAPVRDGAFCLRCGALLQYDRFFYGQMGVYHCSSCEFARPEPRYAGALQVVQGMPDQLLVTEQPATGEWLPGEEQSYAVTSPLTGLYNAYNLLAAVSAARTLGVAPRRIAEGTKNFVAPLGRMQVFAGTPSRTLALIKNPAGADSVLQAIAQDAREKVVCFVINDLDADGRDVSWLWDIDLESLVTALHSPSYVCAGMRAADMALRLAYAGVDRSAITVLERWDAVAQVGQDSDKPVYIVSTYTALYLLADRLAKVTANESPRQAVSAS